MRARSSPCSSWKADSPIKVDTRAKLAAGASPASPSSSSPAAANRAAAGAHRSVEIPIIRTEPSALQNIADTANRLVARMDSC